MTALLHLNFTSQIDGDGLELGEIRYWSSVISNLYLLCFVVKYSPPGVMVYELSLYLSSPPLRFLKFCGAG